MVRYGNESLRARRRAASKERHWNEKSVGLRDTSTCGCVCVCVFKVVCLQFRAEIGSSLLDTAETAEAREVARRLAASVAPTTTNEPWKKAKMKSK